MHHIDSTNGAASSNLSHRIIIRLYCATLIQHSTSVIPQGSQHSISNKHGKIHVWIPSEIEDSTQSMTKGVFQGSCGFKWPQPPGIEVLFSQGV